MKDGLYFGIDVACAKGKTLPAAGLVTRSGIRTLANLRAPGSPLPPKGCGNRVIAEDVLEAKRFAVEACGWLKELEKQSSMKIIKIAIDAPRRPRSPHLSVRDSESDLQEACIQFIKTPTEHEFSAKRKEAAAHLQAGNPVASLPGANLWWMCIGFALFETLTDHWDCVETYPQAILHQIKYVGAHKSKDHAKQLAHIISISGIQELSTESLRVRSFGAPHDRIDALMSAWVASLSPNQIDQFGTAPEDQIWVPALAI